MANFKTLSVQHPSLGTFKVKVDSEDADMLKSKRLYVKQDLSQDREVAPRIAYVENGSMFYAHRVILQEHNMLDTWKNVRPLNGDWFDLRKKNLQVGPRRS